jgi:hypothetical protein
MDGIAHLYVPGDEPFFPVGSYTLNPVENVFSSLVKKLHIRSLTLVRVSASVRQLQNVFGVLAPRLAELKPKNINLLSVSWIFMWRSMAEPLRLRELDFDGFLQSEFEKWTAVPRKSTAPRPPSLIPNPASNNLWSRAMFQFRCFMTEGSPSVCGMLQVEAWILSAGQGPFPIAPFYKPHCPLHNSQPNKVVDACQRESAIRELLGDYSLDFHSDRHAYVRFNRPSPVPVPARILWMRMLAWICPSTWRTMLSNFLRV